ncbi:MAG TPA: hypothetical protein VGE15_01505 [Sphingobacteriaceae bacterium]
MKKLAKLNVIIVSALLFFGCQKETDRTLQPAAALDNVAQSTKTPPPGYIPCQGKCCAFSQGYWFAKPNVVWSLPLTLGGNTYTKAEGQAIWDAVKGGNNSSLFKAFFQGSALVLSGTSKQCDDEIYADMVFFNDLLGRLPKITPDNLDELSSGISESEEARLQEIAGKVGDWIDENHCD